MKADRFHTTPELALRMIAMDKARVSQGQIALELGCAQSTVWKVLRRAAAGHDYAAEAERPAPRYAPDACHDTHLRLISEANNGWGFPALVVPARVRIAA